LIEPYGFEFGTSHDRNSFTGFAQWRPAQIAPARRARADDSKQLLAAYLWAFP
jgi:hypothetical protein